MALSVTARSAAGRGGAWEVRLTGRGRLLARLIASPSTDQAPAPLAQASMQGSPPSPRAMRTEPAVVALADLPDRHAIEGEYRAGPALLGVCARVGAQALRRSLLEGLAWASYVVGMEMPGRHALLAGFTLGAHGRCPDTDEPAERYSMCVTDCDERTGRLLLTGALFGRSGAVQSTGRLECFALEPPGAPEAGAGETAALARPLRGAVVIIGGSRGFGAALALALLAAGYAVHVVYSASAQAASELARAAGSLAARLVLHRIDARDAASLSSLREELTHSGSRLRGLVLNAAPPPLSMGVTGESAAELAEYVAESLRLTAVPLGSLLPALDTEGAWVLFCSSSAITAPPRDWPHYVAAKGALEALALWLATTEPGIATVVVRPPKMRTDLTNTPSGRIGASAPAAVATWIVARLAGDDVGPGLSLLEPDAAEFGAQARVSS